MKVIKYHTGALGVNTYLVLNERTKQCLLIDYGGHSQKLFDDILSLGYTFCGVLLTHGHFDHAGGCAEITEQGYPVYISKNDSEMLQGKGQCNYLFGVDFATFTATVLPENDRIAIAGINFEIIRTPGHTKGGVCYLVDNLLFTGDTLFNSGYGRCDLYGGDEREIFNSIKKLLSLDKDTVILPGHGKQSTIEKERIFFCLKDDYDKD